MAEPSGDGHEAGHPKQSARGLVAIAEDPFEGQAQQGAQQMGKGDQFLLQRDAHLVHSAVPIGRALFVLAPDQDLRGLCGKSVLTQHIGQLHIGLRGETGHGVVMFGQPLQALRHIHSAFNPVIAKG